MPIFLRLALSLAICALGAFRVTAADDVLRFHTFEPAGAFVFTSIWRPWAEQVERDSGGSVEFKELQGGALSKDPLDQLALLDQGKADIAFVIAGYEKRTASAVEAFLLPGVVRTATEGSLAATRLVQSGKLAGFGEHVWLGVFTTQANYLHSTYPVAVPADLSGHPWRSNNRMVTMLLRQFGAEPRSLAGSKIGEALRDGQIDGTINDWNGVFTFGVNGHARYHLDIPMGASVLGLAMSRAAYERLSPQTRAALDRNLGEQLALSWGRAFDARTKALVAETRAKPNEVVSETSQEQQQLWMATIAPIVDGWIEERLENAAILEMVRAEIARVDTR